MRRPDGKSGKFATREGGLDDGLSRGALLDRYCTEIGRDPASILRSCNVPVSYEQPGTTRDAVSRALLKHCYPPMPHWKVAESRIRRVQLKAPVATLTDDREVPLVVEGNVDLVYPDKGADPGVTTATFRTPSLASFFMVLSV